jgi:hypothetical protein
LITDVPLLQAHADLEYLGKDSLGNKLIYDDYFDITWYDYSNSYGTWQNQVDWADALSVTTAADTYTDWRLPATVDGPYVLGYDGTTTAGYNITSSEMGHLFYTDLGNEGDYETSGQTTACYGTSCLSETYEFVNLMDDTYYWSGTVYQGGPLGGWVFSLRSGDQDTITPTTADYYGIAVMSGKAIVPEPISSTLFIVGGATLGLRRFWKKRRTA